MSTDDTLRLNRAVIALQEIASMTYDSWTNGAKAQEIALTALSSISFQQDPHADIVAWANSDPYRNETPPKKLPGTTP